MATKPTKKKQESESLQEQIVKLQKQLESFKHSNDHFLKNKLFLHYDIKEPEKVVVDCETKLPVLTEVDKKKIQKGKEGDPTHLIIEGDNYHALSVLNYTHAGKIDLIYIDPPYNTGNKDFIYNDRFVDREDSFRHSKWLSFMDHRLRLAKNLLSETGVIFISIDDNEQAHLRLLCDQIFGEENFLGTISVVNNLKGRSDDEHIATATEYLLVYAKYEDKFEMGGFPLPEEAISEYDQKDNFGFYKEVGFRKTGKGWRRSDRPNMFYPIYFDPDTEKISLDKFDGAVEILPLTAKGEEGRWRWGKDTFLARYERDIKIRKVRSGRFSVYTKMRIDEGGEERTLLPKSIWIDPRYDTAKGGNELKKLFNTTEEIFENPKPIDFIQDIIRVSTNQSDIILDFFAGSGTTGHAVLKLNAQDGGKRQFILCSTNDEKEPIVDKVLYPRIKKVIEGYSDTAGIPANLRYFKTDFVEKKGSVSQLKIDLTRKCAEMLCVKENVFEEVKLKKAAKNYKFFKKGNKYLAVFFDFFTDPEFTDFIAELNKLPQEAEKAVYIFVLDGSASIFADEFASVTNCEIREIPQKILDIYKQLAREVARK